jgi:hypothetical protein
MREARVCKAPLRHESLSDDTEEGDALVVIAVAAVSFVLVQSDDVGISHVLGDVSPFPAQAEEFVQLLE